MPAHKGEAHYVAKATGLNDDKVRKIRSLYANPCRCCGMRPTMKALAQQFGVSSVSIHNIIHRESWKHVE